MKKFIVMYNRKLNLYVNIGESLNYNFYMHDKEGGFDFEKLPNDLEMSTVIVSLKNNLHVAHNEDVDEDALDLINGLLSNPNSYNVEIVDKLKQIDLLQQYAGVDHAGLDGHMELQGYLNIINPKTHKTFKYGEKYYTNENFTKALLFDITNFSKEETTRIIHVINYIFQTMLSGFQYKMSGLDTQTRQEITNALMLENLGFETLIIKLDEDEKITI